MLNEFDHRALEQSYNLFSFFDEAPGMPVWHERGLRIKNKLIDLWRRSHRLDYQEISSPMLLDKRLWEMSGHCDYFSDHMFHSLVEKRDYIIKPMSCPGAILYYQQKRRSHAELPLRVCELGLVHRNENSGSLHGLLRVRSFMQDDAHIFCAKESLSSEIRGVIKLIEKLMAACGISEFHFELSLRGGEKNYLGSNDDWEYASQVLREAVQDHKLIEREGEAKFYGPSLDVHIKDRHGRFWQCSSIQLDFNLPKRFDLSFINQKDEKEVPFMIHRAIFGSLERFIGILLEHYAKDLPVWLHPVPIKVLSVGESAYAREILEKLVERGVDVESDLSDHPLKEKLKRAYADLVHSVVIVGEKERKSQVVVVKKLKGGEQKEVGVREFLERPI